MFRSQIKLLIVFLLSSFLISFNDQALHSTHSELQSISWDKANVEKKEAIASYKKDYCASDAKVQTIKDPVIDPDTKEQKLDGEGKKIFDVRHSIIISGYHSLKSEKAARLIPNLKSLNYKVKESTPLVEVLKMYCVQKSSEPRPSKFKGSYLEDFYKEIALENGFFNTMEEGGDYNLSVAEGVKGEDILISGIIISHPDAVHYVPDYLIATVEKNKKDASESKSNDDWINQNKQALITDIEKKLTKYDIKIEELQKKRTWIKSKLDEYKTNLEEARELVNDTFDDVDVSHKEIKIKKKEIRADTKKYFKDDNLLRFNATYKKIKDLNLNKDSKRFEYESYKTLKKLLDDTKKSKKKKHFFTKNKKKQGFYDRFEDLKDKELGSQRDERTMNRLNEDINQEIENLEVFIFTPIQELNELDEELSSRFPILQYSIFAGIFLIVIAVIVYIYFQSRRISSLSREPETAGKKFNDIEGKLRDTSEKIKTAGRHGRGRSTADTTTPEPVKEKPKTPEQIIAGKFHDMVSDYNEAIDNFSNVAAFKQKWNGVALTRRPRQDGTKTVLINSSRAFEKSEIWCVNFSDKYFAFPGSSVKSNMAAYMNLDFEKASRDFKGVFDISAGSSWETKPSIVRRGGAGFVVERKGKLIFPS